MRLLLTEDDAMIGEAVQRGLRQLGFALDWVRDGAAAEQALALEPYDLLLLDLGLPRKSGVELLRDLRRRGAGIPVVILTARDAMTDRVAGLDAGADDYVVKPFELPELAARIRAVLRRREGRSNPRLEHRGVTLDPASWEVTQNGRPVPLSAREFAVLLALMEHPGRVLSRAQIEERLYGWGEEIESNTVEVYIHMLRKKLGQDFIKNIRGVGYMIKDA